MTQKTPPKNRSVDHHVLHAAMKKAVELGVFPKSGDTESYMKSWGSMEEILKAAFEAKNGAA